MPDFTYIVEAQNGLVKIGCSCDPRGRLNNIALYSPVLVRLIAMWPATRGEELELHQRFDHLRSHKEWFKVEGPLAALLEWAHGLGVERIPDWSELTFHGADLPIGRLRLARSAAARARWADPEWRAKTVARMRASHVGRPGSAA
jgi:hypothetical protein